MLKTRTAREDNQTSFTEQQPGSVCTGISRGWPTAHGHATQGKGLGLVFQEYLHTCLCETQRFIKSSVTSGSFREAAPMRQSLRVRITWLDLVVQIHVRLHVHVIHVPYQTRVVHLLYLQIKGTSTAERSRKGQSGYRCVGEVCSTTQQLRPT